MPHAADAFDKSALKTLPPVAPATRLLDLSVVVVSWNGAEFLEECLNALYAATQGQDVEIIVVDNASSDGSPDLVRRLFPQARLIANDRNYGVSVAFNQGIRASARPYIQLLCSDTIVQPRALDAMAAFLDAHPEVGAAGPKILYPDGRLQPSCRTFPTIPVFVWEFLGLSRLFPRHPVFGKWRMGNFDHQTLREVDQPRGSSLMVRREMVDQVGGWDERLEMFFNDVDWCLRIKQQGWKIFFVPSAVMTHYGGGSVNKVRPRMILASHRCCYRFFRKHRKGLLNGLAVQGLGVALLASAGIRYVLARLIGSQYLKKRFGF